MVRCGAVVRGASTHKLNDFLVARRPHCSQYHHDGHVVSQAVVLHVDLAVLHVDVAPRPGRHPVVTRSIDRDVSL